MDILPTSLTDLDLTPLKRFSHNVIANIRATGHMLIGSKRAFYWVKPTVWQFLLFGLTALASNLLFSWLVAEDATHFNPQGLISYLVWPMVMLVAGLILAKRHFNAMLIFVPAILWLCADTFMMLVQSLIQFISDLGWLPEWTFDTIGIVFVLAFVWQSLSLLWIFGNQLRWSWIERVLIMLGAFAVLSVWQKNVQSEPIFQSDPVEPVVTEAAFYAQPELLADMLNNVQPQRPTIHDWYFMGVAGHGEQDVFRSEIELTKDYFDHQFGTAGRSVELINNANTLSALPIASKTSIERALQSIAKKMDVNEDVLFLTLTSHGGDKVIEMSNPPLALDNVDAKWLRQSLDKSGIKWRVIVVSACYSGSFINELKSPDTLVITASAATNHRLAVLMKPNILTLDKHFLLKAYPSFAVFNLRLKPPANALLNGKK